MYIHVPDIQQIMSQRFNTDIVSTRYNRLKPVLGCQLFYLSSLYKHNNDMLFLMISRAPYSM